MPKTKISEFSSTPASNTDIDSINISEGCAPSGINDAIRELMAQLKDFQTGAVGDSFNGPVGTTTAAAGAFTTLSASSTVSGTGFSTYLASPPAIGGTAAAAGSFTTLSASGAVTLSGGTANGVAYLNGSKVVTSGSALTFDGTTLNNSGAFGTSTAALTLKNSSAANSSNIVEQQFFAANSFSGLDTIAKFGALNPSAGANNYGTFYWSLANAGSPSEQMRLTSTGLGIGTSSPSYKLDVQSGTATIQIRSSTTSSGAIPKLRFEHAGNDSFSIVGGSYMAWLSSDSTERMRLDSSGNLGLGVTPSAWNASSKAFQFGSTGKSAIENYNGANTQVLFNAYRNSGGSYIYTTSDYAQAYSMNNTGIHAWYTAPSGTAGNAITFTQAMTLDASGNLGVGTTSPSRFIDFEKNQNASTILRVGNTTSGTGAYAALQLSSSSATYLYNFSNAYTTSGIFVAGATVLDAGGSGGLLFNAASVGILFNTGSTERARIDSSGNLLVGRTSLSLGNTGTLLSSGGGITSEISFTGTNEIAVFNQLSTGTTQIDFRYQAVASGYIEWNSTTTSYITSSDYRLKNTIAPMTGALAKVALLKPCTYKWNADGSDGEGFIAHELAEVCPQAVSGKKDAVDKDGNPKYQGVDTSFLVATLTAALQEAHGLIKNLETRISALEAK